MTYILSFLGRFHPLLVHLPIGFLSFALLLQVLSKWQKKEGLLKALPVAWLATAVSSLLAAASGYLLSQAGGYEEEILASHRLAGFALAILSVLVFLLFAFPVIGAKRAGAVLKNGLAGAAFLLLLVTGHWGGSLTHGSDYLTADLAPGADGETADAARIKSLDSADIFQDAVMPILQVKCVSCHNAKKKKGDLLLTGYEDIIKGGKSTAGVVPGNTAMSEIYRRITLPADHKEFMPGNGKKPLTEAQVGIIEWWIETGAHRQVTVAALNPDKRTTELFNDYFQLHQEPILSYQAPAASSDKIGALVKAGYLVNIISNSRNLLEVKFNGNGQSRPDLSLLPGIREQLVWLHLTNCQLSDNDMSVIGKLDNLFKLNLNRNSITDEGAKQLAVLTKLEYLNLYGNPVAGACLPTLVALPQLKKLYAWETRVDSSAVAAVKPANPALELVYRVRE